MEEYIDFTFEQLKEIIDSFPGGMSVGEDNNVEHLLDLWQAHRESPDPEDWDEFKEGKEGEEGIVSILKKLHKQLQPPNDFFRRDLYFDFIQVVVFETDATQPANIIWDNWGEFLEEINHRSSEKTGFRELMEFRRKRGEFTNIRPITIHDDPIHVGNKFLFDLLCGALEFANGRLTQPQYFAVFTFMTNLSREESKEEEVKPCPWDPDSDIFNWTRIAGQDWKSRFENVVGGFPLDQVTQPVYFLRHSENDNFEACLCDELLLDDDVFKFAECEPLPSTTLEDPYIPSRTCVCDCVSQVMAKWWRYNISIFMWNVQTCTRVYVGLGPHRFRLRDERDVMKMMEKSGIEFEGGEDAERLQLEYLADKVLEDYVVHCTKFFVPTVSSPERD